MRKKFLPLCLALFSLPLAPLHTTPLPVGAYHLTSTTPTSGIHSGSDGGILGGTLLFDASSKLHLCRSDIR